MQDNTDDQNGKTDPKAQAKLDRAERYRERMRQSQAIAAQKARLGAAGGTPSDDEAARMVAEFHARGGQVTACPPANDTLEPVEGRGHKRG